MANLEAVHKRLRSQRLTGGGLNQPEDVVRWMGAVQAQDYPAAKWALAQRLNGARDADIEAAFAEGRILRTHVMRPTWHFVLPEDIVWLLALTAPRVQALMAYYDRKLELDGAVYDRSNERLARALAGGKFLTRTEAAAVLGRAGINTDGTQRLGHLMMRAELDGVICSGPKRGKQFTYALLAERARNARALEREEALAELAERYFTSHGPATLKDFVWWSGLAGVDAQAGLEMAKPRLEQAASDGQTYWRGEPAPTARPAAPVAYLLPNFDELTVGYADRSALWNADWARGPEPPAMVILGNVLLLDGRLAGTWKRTLSKDRVHVALEPFGPLEAPEREAVTAAAARYGAFLGLAVDLSW